MCLLIEEPLLDAYFYEGDLLLAAVNAPASAWALLPELGARLRAVITTLPEVMVAGLPRGAAEDLACFVARLESPTPSDCCLRCWSRPRACRTPSPAPT
ncbi:hypothetical protein [Streptomyces sp. KR55]|uniref:hypothetical protein n=1 Tax=Streptomyces sp. KR55 TaxID=3457425 RepID=UPI003FD34FF9